MTFDTAVEPQPSSRQEPGGPNRNARSGRAARYALPLAGVLLVVVAAVAAFSWFTRSNETTTVTVDDDVTRIEVDISVGSVEIISDDTSTVQFESRIEDGWVRSAQFSHQVDGDTLRIHGECRGTDVIPAFGCRTDLALTMPDGVGITVETSAGDIATTGLADDTRLDSSAGNITIAEQAGTVQAHTTAGNIAVTGLSTDEASISSSAGSVDVQAVVPPTSLDAESNAGSVSVEIPAGQAYDVDAKSRTGELTIDAPVDDSSAHKVRAFSHAGAVTVAAR